MGRFDERPTLGVQHRSLDVQIVALHLGSAQHTVGGDHFALEQSLALRMSAARNQAGTRARNRALPGHYGQRRVGLVRFRVLPDRLAA